MENIEIPREVLQAAWGEYMRVKYSQGRSGFVAFKAGLTVALSTNNQKAE